MICGQKAPLLIFSRPGCKNGFVVKRMVVVVVVVIHNKKTGRNREGREGGVGRGAQGDPERETNNRGTDLLLPFQLW